MNHEIVSKFIIPMTPENNYSFTLFSFITFNPVCIFYHAHLGATVRYTRDTCKYHGYSLEETTTARGWHGLRRSVSSPHRG